MLHDLSLDIENKLYMAKYHGEKLNVVEFLESLQQDLSTIEEELEDKDTEIEIIKEESQPVIKALENLLEFARQRIDDEFTDELKVLVEEADEVLEKRTS